MNTRMRGAIAALGALLFSAGCYVSTEPVPVVYAGGAETPTNVEIESSPRSTYDGRDVYYYRSRWYYRDRGNWAYYVREPAELHRQRPNVEHAPPAPRGYARPMNAAPAVQVR